MASHGTFQRYSLGGNERITSSGKTERTQNTDIEIRECVGENLVDGVIGVRKVDRKSASLNVR